MATFLKSVEDCRRLDVEHTRGEPLRITLEFVGAAEIAVVTDRDWSGQIRATADADEVLAEFTKTSETTATLDGGVSARVIVLTSEDAADLDAGVYVFDLQRDSGPGSPYTYVPASRVTVIADVTRAVGS